MDKVDAPLNSEVSLGNLVLNERLWINGNEKNIKTVKHVEEMSLLFDAFKQVYPEETGMLSTTPPRVSSFPSFSSIPARVRFFPFVPRPFFPSVLLPRPHIEKVLLLHHLEGLRSMRTPHQHPLIFDPL